MSVAFGLLYRSCTRLIIACIQMAVCCMDNFPSEIIDYLLVDAWHIENSDRIQSVLWSKRLVRGSLDKVFQLSRRMSTLGQTINTDLIHDILEGLEGLLNRFLDSTQIIIDDVCKLLINQEADIEYRDRFSGDTVLFVAAEGDGNISLKLMPVLSRLGADYSAVDYKGRTPLHLALKPSRSYTARPLRRQSLEKKLVHLLQAGCLIHAVDNSGRTPTDVARKWRRTKAWEAALEVVGKLDCARSKCQCEIVVRLPQAFREGFTLVTKDRDRHATDICRRQRIPNLAMQLCRHSVMGLRSTRTRTSMSITIGGSTCDAFNIPSALIIRRIMRIFSKTLKGPGETETSMKMPGYPRTKTMIETKILTYTRLIMRIKTQTWTATKKITKTPTPAETNTKPPI